MKKARKILSIVLPVLVIAMFMFVAVGPVVMGVGEQQQQQQTTNNAATGVDSSFPSSDNRTIDTVDNLAKSIWGTVLTIAQILSFVICLHLLIKKPILKKV